MTSQVTAKSSGEFFVPVGIGILVQMLCAGLITAVTVFVFAPTASDDTATTMRDAAEPATRPVETSQPDSEVTEAKIEPAPETQSNSASSPDAVDRSSESPKDGTESLVSTDDPLASPMPTTDSTPADLPDPAADVPTPEVRVRPLDDIRARSRVLPLPLVGEGSLTKVTLCRIVVPDPDDVRLEILGGHFPTPHDVTLQLERMQSDQAVCTWTVVRNSPVGFDRRLPVGIFELDGQQFSFTWLKDADRTKLPFCRLRVSADGDTETCDLWSTVHPPPFRVRFHNPSEKLSPFVAAGVLLPADALRLELSFDNWPEHERNGESLVSGQSLDIVFPDEDSEHDLLKIQLSLTVQGGSPAIDVACFTTCPKALPRKNEVRFEELELSYKSLEKLMKDAEVATKKYQAEADKLTRVVDALQADLDNVQGQLELRPAQELAIRRERLARQLEEKTVEQDENQQMLDTFSASTANLTSVSDLCRKIENGSGIHFRLIRTLAGTGPDIVVSSSIVPIAAQTEEAP